MNNTNTVGVDLAKNTFHLCIQNNKGNIIKKVMLSRPKFKQLLATEPSSRVVFESCSTSHYWFRVATGYGHTVQLIHPTFVKAFVKTNKNDFNDAEAICEAASRPSMRYVSPKSIAQQDIQLLHRIRQRQVQQRTAISNQIRGQLLEYGLTIPSGIRQVKIHLSSYLEEPDNELTALKRVLFNELREELAELNHRISDSDKKIKQMAAAHPVCERLMKIPGVGPITATALISTIGKATNFKNGRELSAWLGLVPKQHSTGGKNNLLGISKRGDSYVRTLLVQGAISAMTRCKNKTDNQLLWAQKLRANKGLQKASVALANKMARIIWSVMANDHDYVVMN
jgi:transposase